MTTITIETTTADKQVWRALVGNKVSFGKTAGEALDHLTAQLSEEDSSTIVVRQMQPDRFFTAAQQQRMAELMTKWRAARDAGSSLLPEEQAELEALVEAELNGSAQRAEQLLHDLKK
jgi:hypothetical protein